MPTAFPCCPDIPDRLDAVTERLALRPVKDYAASKQPGEYAMHADRTDLTHDTTRPTTGLPVIPLVLGVALVVIAAAWYLLGTGEPPAQAPPAPAEPAVVAKPTPAPPPPAPDIPEPAPEPVAPVEPLEPEIPAPPPLKLEESDMPVREALASEVAGTPLAPALDNQELLTRAASLIDATSQGRMFHQVLKLPPPEASFSVIEIDGAAYIDPDSFQRYDAYAQAIAGVDPATVASAFHNFRPLLEEAYAALGYEGAEMDNALVRALDQVIAAPVLDEPAPLERDVTTWHYVDPALEELPSLSKQLLRMGPENQALIQAKARAIREALLAP
jgi:hypothetical protein